MQCLWEIICQFKVTGSVPDKARIFTFIMHISSLNPTFDNLLESSHRDDSNKWSNIGIGEEITHEVFIEVNFINLT